MKIQTLNKNKSKWILLNIQNKQELKKYSYRKLPEFKPSIKKNRSERVKKRLYIGKYTRFIADCQATLTISKEQFESNWDVYCDQMIDCVEAQNSYLCGFNINKDNQVQFILDNDLRGDESISKLHQVLESVPKYLGDLFENVEYAVLDAQYEHESPFGCGNINYKSIISANKG